MLAEHLMSRLRLTNKPTSSSCSSLTYTAHYRPATLRCFKTHGRCERAWTGPLFPSSYQATEAKRECWQPRHDESQTKPRL